MARHSNRNTDNDRTDAAGTVTVACRLPSGLSVDVLGHGTLLFKGANDKRALALAGEQGFHGLTSGVPKDAWDALTVQYATAKWLTGGFVFATTKARDALKEAQERGDVNAGFNQIDPETQGVEDVPKSN
jgi:hypothetical protein